MLWWFVPWHTRYCEIDNNWLAMACLIGITLQHMKCAAVFLLISLALTSELSAVLRPRFPVKPTPPFRDDVIVIEDGLVRSLSKNIPPAHQVNSRSVHL